MNTLNIAFIVWLLILTVALAILLCSITFAWNRLSSMETHLDRQTLHLNKIQTIVDRLLQTKKTVAQSPARLPSKPTYSSHTLHSQTVIRQPSKLIVRTYKSTTTKPSVKLVREPSFPTMPCSLSTSRSKSSFVCDPEETDMVFQETKPLEIPVSYHKPVSAQRHTSGRGVQKSIRYADEPTQC